METGKRLIGPLRLTNTAATVLGPLDPGVTDHIIHIHAYNNTASPVNFTMSIGTDSADTRIFDAIPIPANKWLYKTGLIVVATGEIVQAFASVANAVNFVASGIEVVA